MKKSILLLVLLFDSLWCYNQTLSVQETIDYINDIIKNQLGVDWISPPNKMLKSNIPNQSCRGVYYLYITLSEGGDIVIMRHFILDMCKYDIDNGNQSDVQYVRFHNSIVSIPSIVADKYNRITFKGKNNDKTFGGEFNNYAFEFLEIKDSYDQQRCLKAIRYLFTTMQNDKNYSRNNLNDPFAPDQTPTQKPSSFSETTNKQSETGTSQLNLFPAHYLAAPKKYTFQGENTSGTLELRYKNPTNNITYYLTSYNLPPNTNIQYYLESFRNNQIKDGFTTSEITYQGKKAIYGKLQIETAYIYQLHFVNLNRGQTIQMLAGKPSELEFEKYKNEIIITK